MPHPRRILVALAAPLLVLAAAVLVPASAVAAPPVVTVVPDDDTAPADDPTTEPPSGLTLCAQEAAGYVPRGGCQLVVVRAASACVGGAPVLDYEVRPEGTDLTSLSITWEAPGGGSVVYSGLPLTGRVLWPGTVIEAGKVVDWPGWTRTADGQWAVGDEYDWVRPQVSLLMEVNPQARITVSYPPETAPCAGPPTTPITRTVDVPAGAVDQPAQQAVVRSAAPTQAAPVSALAATGVDVDPVLRAGAGLLATGVFLVLVGHGVGAGRRRRRG